MGGTLSCAGDRKGQYGEDKVPYGGPIVRPVENGIHTKAPLATETSGTYSKSVLECGL